MNKKKLDTFGKELEETIDSLNKSLDNHKKGDLEGLTLLMHAVCLNMIQKLYEAIK